MGLRTRYIQYINQCILHEFVNYQNIKMLELGDQVIKGSAMAQGSTGKEYFTNLNIDHTSIDMNGRHGALKYDLSKEIIRDDWIGHFNVITNSGTSEHVEPFKSQYECFENIHKFCCLGGIMVHIIPDALEIEKMDAFKKKHCNNYYTRAFFELISQENGYYMLDTRMRHALRYVCLKKIKNVKFMNDRDLFLSNIVRKEGGKEYKF